MVKLQSTLFAATVSVSVVVAGACGGDGDGERAEEPPRTDAQSTTTRPPSDVVIDEIVADPDEEEAVVLSNRGEIQADIGGWQVVVDGTTMIVPFSTKIEPGGELTIARGEGDDSGRRVHADIADPAIEDGDTVELRDAHGRAVTTGRA